jgi:FeoC-like transcriptional regulator
MLERLLGLVRVGGTYHIGDLARALDTSPELVEAMLETLQRLGYLKRVGDTCAEACSGCPLARACGANAGSKLWTLTEQGRKARQLGGV